MRFFKLILILAASAALVVTTTVGFVSGAVSVEAGSR